MLINFFSGLNPIYQALIATLFTWFVTALGSGLVFFFKRINRKPLDAMLGFAAGVEGETHAAEDEHPEVGGDRGRRRNHGQHAGSCGQGGHEHHDSPAGEPVGEPADRELERHAAHHRGADEDGDLGRSQPDRSGVERAESHECPMGHPDQERNRQPGGDDPGSRSGRS